MRTTSQRRIGGFSLVEVLLVVAVLSALGSVGVVAMTNIRSGAEEAKLRHDVAVVNAAIRVYLGNGGSLETAKNPQAVLEALKKEASEDGEVSDRLVGLTGSLIDARLHAVTQKAKDLPAGKLRAVWDREKGRFAMSTARGAGVTRFVLSDDVVRGQKYDGRQTAVLYAADSGWVWDHGDFVASGPPASPGPGGAPGTPGGMSAPVPPSPLQLEPPVFSVSGGEYPYGAFDLPLTFTNTNPSGASEIVYSVNGGAFKNYTGGPVPVPINAAVEAYSRTLDPDHWIDSEFAGEEYRLDSLLFSGLSEGAFLNPVGDDDLVSNLLGGGEDKLFEFGSPAHGYTSGNYLRFEGAEFENINAGQEFLLGTLTYFNSTTWAGTNATEVDFNLTLDLKVPDVVNTFAFGFSLLSTPNKTEQTADENADYVWLGDMTSDFTTWLDGKEYALELNFGSHSGDAFTTIDTFHVHEGHSSSGQLFGRLVEVEAAPEQPVDDGGGLARGRGNKPRG